MRASKPFIGLSIITIASVIGASSAFAIRQGTATNDLLKTVMATKATITVGQENFDIWGTATNVKYPRCFLTAEHNLTNPNTQQSIGDAQISIVQGQHPITQGGKSQKVGGRSTSHEAYAYATPMWFDLVVLLLEAKEGENRLVKADYAPIAYGGNLGPANTAYTGQGFGSGAETAGHRDVDIIGYGAFSGSTMTGPLSVMGMGHKRKGVAHARNLVSGPSQTPAKTGGFYTVVPTASGGKLACPGDSGGPLFKTGDTTTTYGVASGASPTSCNAATFVYYTVIDDNRILPNGDSTKKWIDTNVALVCAARLNSFINPTNGGAVTGTLVGATFTSEDNTIIDGDIACGVGTDDDCTEMVHDGESITLTATPDTGYHFVRWQDKINECPCDGSTDPECLVEFDDMGTYTEEVSIDVSDCEAVFEVTLPPE